MRANFIAVPRWLDILFSWRKGMYFFWKISFKRFQFIFLCQSVVNTVWCYLTQSVLFISLISVCVHVCMLILKRLLSHGWASNSVWAEILHVCLEVLCTFQGSVLILCVIFGFMLTCFTVFCDPYFEFMASF